MMTSRITGNHFRLSWQRLLLVAGIALLGAVDRAQAQTEDPIVRIEEDWELDLKTPHEDGDSPQITTAMSPHYDNEYCSFELNHQSQPDFAPGGIHLHAWDGDFVLSSAHEQTGLSLQSTGEHISWTQAMSINSGELSYEISQFDSDTWSSFTGTSLLVSVDSQFDDLNDYDWNESILNSGVGYGSNRVQTLKLRTVRFITAGGNITELNVNYDIVQ